MTNLLDHRTGYSQGPPPMNPAQIFGDKLIVWVANGTDRLLEQTGRMSQISMPIGPPEERNP